MNENNENKAAPKTFYENSGIRYLWPFLVLIFGGGGLAIALDIFFKAGRAGLIAVILTIAPIAFFWYRRLS